MSQPQNQIVIYQPDETLRMMSGSKTRWYG